MKNKFKIRDVVEVLGFGNYNLSPIFKLSPDGQWAYVDLFEGKQIKHRREMKVHISNLILIAKAKQALISLSVLRNVLPKYL